MTDSPLVKLQWSLEDAVDNCQRCLREAEDAYNANPWDEGRKREAEEAAWAAERVNGLMAEIIQRIADAKKGA